MSWDWDWRWGRSAWLGGWPSAATGAEEGWWPPFGEPSRKRYKAGAEADWQQTKGKTPGRRWVKKEDPPETLIGAASDGHEWGAEVQLKSKAKSKGLWATGAPALPKPIGWVVHRPGALAVPKPIGKVVHRPQPQYPKRPPPAHVVAAFRSTWAATAPSHAPPPRGRGHTFAKAPTPAKMPFVPKMPFADAGAAFANAMWHIQNSRAEEAYEAIEDGEDPLAQIPNFDLVGPKAWRCPSTGQKIRYWAARVAKGTDPPCSQSEPVVLYLAGLGDASCAKGSELRKRVAIMHSWNLGPFLFVAPMRTPGRWWVVDGEETNYGWLGDFVPSELLLIADLVKRLAGPRPILALGFSAGAYCLTELLALGRLQIKAAAFGGLHAHGQSDLEGIPKKRQYGVLEKFEEYLQRLRQHPGVPGGIFAVHGKDDGWSPMRYAMPALEELGARNQALGFPRVRLAVLPEGSGGHSGHDYEGAAIWRQWLLRQLLKHGRVAAKPKGSVGLLLRTEELADVVDTDNVAAGSGGLPSASECSWIPRCDSDAPAVEPELGGDDEQPDTLWDQDWEPEQVGEAEAPEPEWAEDETEADGWEAAVEDPESAQFESSPAECFWNFLSCSNLELDLYTVEAESPCLCGTTPAWSQRAAEIFRDFGFVLVLGALDPRKAAQVYKDCQALEPRIVSDFQPKGNRHGGARYSFGKASSTNSLIHIPSFAKHLLDNWAVMAVMESISELKPSCDEVHPSATRMHCIAAGGDFVLPGEGRFQAMHNDMGCESQKNHIVLPPPVISVNFAVAPISGLNGPMRMVPGTQGSLGYWDGYPVEPAEWRGTRLFPLPVGAAIFRDVRTLHGGSPNFSKRTRFLPSVEFASLHFLQTARGTHFVRRESMPRKLFDSLRPSTQARVCPQIVAPGHVDAQFRKK